MAVLNYSTREVVCKIVYYGPGLSGKTTNLQQIHKTVAADSRGELVSLATDQDRTLFFDFLPLDLGQVKGFSTKFQLYTVPGQVYYNATRRIVLRGVDGVVFVADSAPDKMDENTESLANLKENLDSYGLKLSDMPFVIQYNKRDLPDAMPVEKMQALLNDLNVSYTEAVACEGQGVKDTLKLISRKVVSRLNVAKGLESTKESGGKVEFSAGEIDADGNGASAPASKSASREMQAERLKSASSSRPMRTFGPAAESRSTRAAVPGNLAIRQRSRIRWNGLPIGEATIELTKRQNLDHRGDFQLTESSRLLGLFRNVQVRVLSFDGEEARWNNGDELIGRRFRDSDNGNGNDFDVWVTRDADSHVFIERRGLGGGLEFAPSGYKGDTPKKNQA